MTSGFPPKCNSSSAIVDPMAHDGSAAWKRLVGCVLSLSLPVPSLFLGASSPHCSVLANSPHLSSFGGNNWLYHGLVRISETLPFLEGIVFFLLTLRILNPMQRGEQSFYRPNLLTRSSLYRISRVLFLLAQLSWSSDMLARDCSWNPPNYIRSGPEYSFADVEYRVL